MQLKKAIALFCLIVLCMQVLPVKQIGAILFNNQITEEIAHAHDSKKQTAKNESDHYFPAYLNYAAQEITGANKHNAHKRFDLVRLHYAEVPTLPPNLV